MSLDINSERETHRKGQIQSGMRDWVASLSDHDASVPPEVLNGAHLDAEFWLDSSKITVTCSGSFLLDAKYTWQ